MLMMMPPLLRYFWFHSTYSLTASCSLQSAVCSLQSAIVIHRVIVTTIAFHIRHFFAFITIYDICNHSECLLKVSEDYFSRGMLLVWTFAQKLRQQVNICFTPYWNRCSHCKVLIAIASYRFTFSLLGTSSATHVRQKGWVWVWCQLHTL